MTKVLLKRALVISLTALSFATAAPIPAQAHFERGGNCHFEDIRANGTIVMRITNRTGRNFRVTCVLNFNVGRNGYMYANLEAHTWQIVRHRFFGQWTRVNITHIHLTPIGD